MTWADPHPLDVDEQGTVRDPTAEDIAYARREYGEVFPERHILVRWDGESWDEAWHPPEHLRVVAPKR